MQVSEFYLNDKIVSVRLFNKSLDGGFIWDDKFTYITSFLGKKKEVKLDCNKWICTEDIKYRYPIYKKINLFDTDDELLKFLNVKNKFQIIDKQLYISPSVQFTYVNKNVRTVYFDTFESAERYYNDLKRKFNGEYIIFV